MDPLKKIRTPVNLKPTLWYHGPITRNEAETLLSSLKPGLFLVRESVNYRGDFTLCVVSSDKLIEHYRIIYNSNSSEKFTIDEETYFKDLNELVMHYSRDADGLAHRLEEPLYKKGTPCFPLVLDVFKKNDWILPDKEFSSLKKIGEGESSVVYEGKYRNTMVAAKCIPQNRSDHPNHERNLILSSSGLNEAAVMTALDHKNIVKFFGLIVNSEEKIYLVFELMDLGSLVEYLRTRGKFAISQKELLSFSSDICSALVYLAEKRLLHRDVAARNVLLGQTMDGSKPIQAKLSDFGLCRPIGTKDTFGKVPVKWTAIEAIENKDNFSLESEVWSFGVTLWEIFSFGKIPYMGVPVGEVLEELKAGTRLPKPADCSEEIFKLMESCWLMPNQRPKIQDIHKRLSIITRSI